MVFTSLPAAYFDPSNWQQQPNPQQTGATTVTASSQLLPPALPPPPPPPPPPHGSGGAGSIRPGSMADRARLANIPMPETALKCPRCESTNTKFCYFNNYSLTQPRHFCKTCRRYWTRGGALRNVPVGGGCRRNKRSKGSSSSKSPVSSDRPTGSGSTATVSSNSTGSHDILGLGGPQVPSLRFMAPLHHHLSEFGDIGFGYNSITAPIGPNHDLNFQIGSAFASAGSSLMSVGGLEQWRLQQQQHQFPFLGGLDSSNSSSHSSGLYPFDHGSMEGSGFGLVRPKLSSSVATQLASVKMEESQELNLARQFLGNMNIPSGNDNQYWNTGNGTANNSAWTDLSSFSSSSTSNNPM